MFRRFSKPAKLANLLLDRFKAIRDRGNPLDSLSIALSDRSNSLVLASKDAMPCISSAVSPFERNDSWKTYICPNIYIRI